MPGQVGAITAVLRSNDSFYSKDFTNQAVVQNLAQLPPLSRQNSKDHSKSGSKPGSKTSSRAGTPRRNGAVEATVSPVADPISSPSFYSGFESSNASNGGGRKTSETASADGSSPFTPSSAPMNKILSHKWKTKRWDDDSEPMSPGKDKHARRFEETETEVRQSYADASRSRTGLWRYRAKEAIQSNTFDACMGVVIALNSAAIGLEQTFALQGRDTDIFTTLEIIFLAIYGVELGLRFACIGLRCLEDAWVRFDTVLVFLGILPWIMAPFMGDSVDQMGSLAVLRMTRLMRLARAMRLLIKFRELWMLVRGLMHSGSVLLYTMSLIFVILYVFSCMSIELITNHPLAMEDSEDPEFREHVKQNFDTLPMTMVTLLQFVSFDNVVLIYRPLCAKDWRLFIFFLTIIAIVGVVLMNLVTAVIVNSALEQAMQDKDLIKTQQEKDKKKLVKDLREIFLRLDEDKSGQVSREEIMNVSVEDKERLHQLMSISDPMEIFGALDVDDSGNLEIDEFCDGIWQVAISKAPIEMKRMEKMMECILRDLKATSIVQEELQQELTELRAEARLNAALKGRDVTNGTDTPRSETLVANVQVPELVNGPAWASELLHTVRREANSLQNTLDTVLSKIQREVGPSPYFASDCEFADVPQTRKPEAFFAAEPKADMLLETAPACLVDLPGPQADAPAWAMELLDELRELRTGGLHVLVGQVNGARKEEKDADDSVVSNGHGNGAKKEEKEAEDRAKATAALPVLSMPSSGPCRPCSIPVNASRVVQAVVVAEPPPLPIQTNGHVPASAKKKGTPISTKSKQRPLQTSATPADHAGPELQDVSAGAGPQRGTQTILESSAKAFGAVVVPSCINNSGAIDDSDLQNPTGGFDRITSGHFGSTVSHDEAQNPLGGFVRGVSSTPSFDNFDSSRAVRDFQSSVSPSDAKMNCNPPSAVLQL